MKFSLIAPSIRPHLWKQFYDSVKNTKIDFEVIFVGPTPPVGKLPSNFRWITTSVKPSQCTHIGFMEAKGEIVSLTADDARYFSPDGESALDNMYDFIKNFSINNPTCHIDSKKMAYGFRMFEDKFVGETSYSHRIISKELSLNYTPPLLYPFFVVYRDLYLELGGYDNRFICGQAENDFLLRVFQQCGDTDSTLCPRAMVWADHEEHTNSGSFRKYHPYEVQLVKKLWINSNNQQSPMRLDGNIYKYTTDNLLTVSQGEKGEWN